MVDPWCVICTLGVLLAPAPVPGFEADSSRPSASRQGVPSPTTPIAHGVALKFSSRLDLMREVAAGADDVRKKPHPGPPAQH